MPVRVSIWAFRCCSWGRRCPVALMTLLLNFRHIVYGLSMLEKFQTIHGLRKFYLILH